jgi:hypothetical protein
VNKNNKKKTPSRVAFIPIGIALMVVGFNGNNGLIGAGALFLIIGMAALTRDRKSQNASDETDE